MESSQLVELAGVVATHARVLVAETPQLSQAGLAEYWTASKCRLNRWGLALRDYVRRSDAFGYKWAHDRWHEVLPTLEGILLSEVLARVWATVACMHQQIHHDSDAAPVVRSVLNSHQEARHRVLSIMSGGPLSDTPQTRALNHLRRRCERWTDLLVAHVGGDVPILEFAFDPLRSEEFQQSLCRQQRSGAGAIAWNLTLTSLRMSFLNTKRLASPEADLNARVAGGILCCFPPTLFDATGQLKSLWLMRIQTATQDAQGMLEEILNEWSTDKGSLAVRARRRENL